MFALAFTDAKLVSPQAPRFIGLDSFVRLFTDPLFWRSLQNTAVFALVVVPVQAGLALGWRCWSTSSCGASTSSAPSTSCPWSPRSW